ncbi:MAG: hypothetical protein IPP90_17035 [Gemmatimonadaceae bacterium]|nr:hypothetical protein [Gemmatimonadaceae bacterium]
MTTRSTSMPDQQLAAAAETDFATARAGADIAPYARPAASSAGHAVDAVLIDAIRAAVGPYVPLPWRSQPTDSSGMPMALPWIDTFLDASPPDAAVEAMPVAAITTFVTVSAKVGDAADMMVESRATENVESIPTPDATEIWPLDDAGASMRALAEELLTREPTPPRSTPEVAPFTAAPVASTPPLPMWGDDDMMDIMPIKSSRPVADAGEHWAASARRESERAGHPEAAAQALEALARRIRDGEIVLPGYSPDMGDAAALATALAALLSVRR